MSFLLVLIGNHFRLPAHLFCNALSVQNRVYLVVRIRAVVAADSPEIEFVKYVSVQVYKKTLLQRLRSPRFDLSRGTGVRYQVSSCVSSSRIRTHCLDSGIVCLHFMNAASLVAHRL
jgi:hypothetical protein